MRADYSVMFKNWHLMDTVPMDHSLFMGRQTGTNRAFAVTRDVNGNFIDASGKPVSICQWISFAEYAQIQHCVWRTN